MKKTFLVAVVLSATCLGLSACGSSKSASTTTTTVASTATTETVTTGAPPGVTLSGVVSDHGTKTFASGTVSAAALDDGGSNHLELFDNYFQPSYIKATPGSTISIGLDNEGQNTHTFTIKSQNIDVQLPHETKKTVKVVVPQSGFLEFTCTIHGGGMRGGIVASS